MGEIITGLPALALHFGKSLRQVQRWAADPSFPRLSGKRFDLDQVRVWLEDRRGRPARNRLGLWADLAGLGADCRAGVEDIRRGLATIAAAARSASRHEREQLLITIGLQLLEEVKIMSVLLKAWHIKGPNLFE